MGPQWRLRRCGVGGHQKSSSGPAFDFLGVNKLLEIVGDNVIFFFPIFFSTVAKLDFLNSFLILLDML